MGGDAGGLFDSATTSQTITNDTLTANSAGAGGDGGNGGTGPAVGGNAGDGGGGGAIVSAGAALDVVDLTIADNFVGVAGSAGIGNGAANGSPGDPGMGGAISAYGSARFQNTIVASNTGTSCLGVIVDGGHNLGFPDASCGAGFATGDPKLAPLADNGGPTQTIALLPGSAAIDAVPATGAGCPATDQRGVTRPQGRACDIGAYEAAVPENTARPVISGAPQPGATLTCSTGTWINYPQSFSYLWLRDGAAIPGATAASHTAAVADRGHSLTCQVTAFDQTGSAQATSARVTINPVPALSKLRLHPSAFKHRTKITYHDSVNGATTTFTVLVHHRNKWVRVGSFTHHDRAGVNKVALATQLPGHNLKPGSYRLVATASLGGVSSRSLTVAFRIEG
jgi:hypothetical protein